MIILFSKLFGLEEYLKNKMESDPDFKSYLEATYYRKIYIEKEENRKKEGEIEVNSDEET